MSTAKPVTIEKGVPVPVASGRGPKRVYPLDLMAVGDSFLFPRGFRPTGLHDQAHSVGVQITVRKVPDGYRVWRIA